MHLTALAGIDFERFIDPVEQILFAKRLADKIERATPHRLDGHRNVAVPRDKNDRKRRTQLQQMCLQIEAGHSGHANIQHETSALSGVEGVEERDRGFE